MGMYVPKFALHSLYDSLNPGLAVKTDLCGWNLKTKHEFIYLSFKVGSLVNKNFDTLESLTNLESSVALSVFCLSVIFRLTGYLCLSSKI